MILHELFPMPQKNRNDALFQAGFRLQAAGRNIKELKFSFIAPIMQAQAMTLKIESDL